MGDFLRFRTIGGMEGFRTGAGPADRFTDTFYQVMARNRACEFGHGRAQVVAVLPGSWLLSGVPAGESVASVFDTDRGAQSCPTSRPCSRDLRNSIGLPPRTASGRSKSSAMATKAPTDLHERFLSALDDLHIGAFSRRDAGRLVAPKPRRYRADGPCVSGADSAMTTSSPGCPSMCTERRGLHTTFVGNVREQP